MIDIVKQLFENNVISEEMQSEIETAWQQKVQENRDHTTTALREEFAQKYEHDKTAMVEAVDSMISERLTSELKELAEDRKLMIEARTKYVNKMKKDSQAMESFIFNILKKEISELHEDRRTVAGNVEKLESFIVNALAKEIAEFHVDKADLAETKVNLISKSKAKFEEAKKDFIKSSAKIIEETVSKGLRSEMTQLKEDIESARRNDFGRRIFESFASEYAVSHLNEKSETAKLLKVVEEKDSKLKEAANIVKEKEKIVESKEAELVSLKNRGKRNKIMSELLTPLKGEKKSVMTELLESVQTDRLRSAFDKYLPAVLNSGTSKKAPLTESVEITGDKKAPKLGSQGKTAEIVDIRRLAGLKN